MPKLLTAALLVTAIFPAYVAAQERPAGAGAYEKYAAAFGVLANPIVVGVQAEVRFLHHMGGRLLATQVFDYSRQNEFGGGAIALLTYYVPLQNPRIEPVLGLGGVYSLYHWDTGYDRGNLTDFNVGGGMGVNLRFSNHFRTGINVLAANSFAADYKDGAMRAVRRKLLVMPALTFDVLL